MKTCPKCGLPNQDNAISCDCLYEFGSACTDLKPGVLESSATTHVIVTDIQMPFGSMVAFMVKWAIASIPAAIILVIVGSFFWAFMFAMFGALRRP